jgi:UDP-N-acetylglucosamine transferase subunit ALG13
MRHVEREGATPVADPLPGRQLLAASTGGHLAQLAKWSQAIGSASDSLWVTFKSPQSDSLLQHRRVLYVPYVAPRDVRGAVNAFVRVNGPSLTGMLASLDPHIHTYCQYEHWAGRRWHYRRSLFDSYEMLPKPEVERPRLFVTLGTIYPYRFDALVDAILLTGLADSQTVWQLGTTTRRGLPGTAVSQMGAAEFEDCARAADVVITHAGVGTIMHLLEMGLFPVVVPRRAKRNEHIDDHQAQIAGLLNSRAISMVTETDELDRNTIIAASAISVRSTAADKGGYAATTLHLPSGRTEIT